MEKEKNRLVWIDLEMTGLDPDFDEILEIATIITDNDLTMIAQGPTLVIFQSEEVLAKMNTKVKEMHTSSGLIEHVRSAQTPVDEAQQQTLDFIKQYCPIHSSPLCGNTIYQDRMFLRRYMPKLNAYLHYRNLDVSSIKEVVTRWYPNDPHAQFKKKDAHRALEDIQESIEELRHYRNYFFRI